MKNRILIITPYLMQGGVEHSLITALSGIDYESNDVTLYLYRDELSLLSYVPKQVRVIKGFDKTHYYRNLYVVALLSVRFMAKIIGLKNFEKKVTTAISKHIHNKKVLYPNVKYFKNKKFDVVISYCLHIGTEMALNVKSNKYYLFLHNSHTDYHVDVFEKCLDYYDSLIAVSEGVKQVYSNKYPEYKSKFVVIDNFVDASEIIKKSKSYTIDYRKHSGEYILCTCGRLATEKGFDLAIQAAFILKEKGYSILWYFVGDGYLRDDLEKDILEYKLEENIMITGYKDNPYPYINFCDIYIQPSYEESQGLAIYEALVLGKPIVSTDTVGGRCTLEEGRKGLLVPITGNGIAAGIEQLINDKVKRCDLENLISIESNLTKKKKYFDSWNKLLNSNIEEI